MDATVSQLLLGVATNIFSATIERGAADAFEVDAEGALESAIRQAADRVEFDAALDRDVVAAFLRGPEVATTLRMLFIARANERTSTSTQTAIEAEFRRAFRVWFPDRYDVQAVALFGGLVDLASAALQAMAGRGSDAAAVALDSYRFGYLKEELAGLKASLGSIKRSDLLDLDEIETWEELYRSQVQSRHGMIVPPSLDTADRVPVDDIYLAPTFRLEGGDSYELTLETIDLASNLNRAVVLGDPGAGKSTFAAKLTFDLAGKRIELPGGSPIPFLVDLKEYGAEKQRSRISILEWIESVVSSDYSSPAPAEAIGYLLSSGRAAVIFDGLDELLDTSHRKQITADIESFASRYVATPILVTSRRVGYRQAPLDQRRFVAYGLNELDKEQIQRYVSVWFGLRRELTVKVRAEMAESFLEDSYQSADDLRRNMLMLGLLCNLYRGEGYIPRHRPQVYEKCAVMLFERWDKGRRIVVELEFERHLRPAMQHLAYWIYSEPGLRSGVTEAELVKSATAFLLDRRFENDDEARAEAFRFVEFCSGRAWVFTDTGTTADGDRLYQFTHRTFLEFFAAEHLVRTESSPESLLSVLRPRIAAGEWDVVAQLAFQLQDDNIDGAADALLGSLMESRESQSVEERKLMSSFAARTLSFLVPRRDTCRTVARVVTSQTLAWVSGERDSVPGEAAVAPDDVHLALVRVDRENFQPVSREMLSVTDHFLAESPEDGDRVRAAAEVALNADMGARGTAIPDQPLVAFTLEACEILWPKLEPHANRIAAIAYDGFWFGKLGVDVLLAEYSTDILFESREFALYGSYVRDCPIKVMFSGQVGGLLRPNGTSIGRTSEFAAVGSAFETAPTPWDTRNVKYVGMLDDPNRLSPRDQLTGPALFGGFAALAWTAEHMFRADEIEILLTALRSSSGWLRQLQPYILHRFESDQEQLPELDCGEHAAVLIDAWANGGWSATSSSFDGERELMRPGLTDVHL